jgi:hypothetical protein
MRGINSAYRYFTIRYFTEGGIEYVDEYMGPERAQAISRKIQLQKQISGVESKFCDYVGREDVDPQRQLSTLLIFERLYGDIDAARMRRFEASLPEGSRAKLVFTKQEAALELFDFYNGPLRMALTEDLENPDSKNIYNHMQEYDWDRIRDVKMKDVERYEAAVRTFVEKLLLWINEITPEGVLGDIDRVLEEHGKPSHWQPVSPRSKKRRITCHHESRYVQMTCHPENSLEAPLHLWPSRTPVYDDQYDGPMVEYPSFKVDADWPRRTELGI